FFHITSPQRICYIHILFYLLLSLPPPRPTLFPYTTLFRSISPDLAKKYSEFNQLLSGKAALKGIKELVTIRASQLNGCALPASKDRKSTRLNSSHVSISYAVFCLKKKKNNQGGPERYEDNI